MRIFLCVAVRVMHTMQHGIRPWVEEGRTLRKPCQKIEKLLPFFSGGIHLVRSIPVQEKSMEEQ